MLKLRRVIELGLQKVYIVATDSVSERNDRLVR